MHKPSRKKLKNAPIPDLFMLGEKPATEEKLMIMIRDKFRRMFGGFVGIKTAQRKEWGDFLFENGILWKVNLPYLVRSGWEEWDVSSEKGRIIATPKNKGEYLKTYCYFIPLYLAEKMLVLGFLP